MTAPASSPLSALPADRRAEVARAVAALREGRLVVLPTETVYGVFASATDPDALGRLLQLTGPTAGPADPLAWHTADADAVRGLLALSCPAHIRLTRRLMPGPVTWIIEDSGDAAEKIRERLAPVEGAIVSGRIIALRVTDHPLASAVLGAAGIPVVARSVSAAGFGAGASLPRGFASSPPEAIGLVIDGGPTRHGRPSTTVRLGGGGTLSVEAGGALEERFVRKQLERTILFVCTGNTCRSPMAAAIARHLLAQAPPDGILTTVRSAGVSAAPGYPATPEAAEAVRRLGAEMGRHSSARINREAIAGADLIFTMTPEHSAAVLAQEPGAASKVRTLDPAGGAVADPVGEPQEVYDAAAAHIRDLLSVRLKELEP